MPTIREVAAQANVSVATVSRVINQTHYVSPELKERVLAAMQELNYHPSALARSLRRQETMTIGVLVPQLDHPFFSSLVSSVENALFDDDYRTLVCSAEETPEKEGAYVEMLMRQRVDGVIMVPTGHSQEHLRHLQTQNVPVVLVDRDLNYENVDKVVCDNFKGGYEGMRHLIERGHRRIAVLGAPAYSEAMTLRVNGVRRAATEAEIACRPMIRDGGTLQQFEIGYNTAMRLLTMSERPTAIFALTDVMAIGVFHAAAQLGLRLPEDVSVMGFDNIPLASYSIPVLTTVAQPIYAMGQAAARILIRRIHDNSAPYETVTLQTQLIVRRSVAAPINGHEG